MLIYTNCLQQEGYKMEGIKIFLLILIVVLIVRMVLISVLKDSYNFNGTYSYLKTLFKDAKKGFIKVFSKKRNIDR